jgi:hypothetical protein
VPLALVLADAGVVPVRPNAFTMPTRMKMMPTVWVPLLLSVEGVDELRVVVVALSCEDVFYYSFSLCSVNTYSSLKLDSAGAGSPVR